MIKEIIEKELPDIFSAATNNDVAEMTQALSQGQSLDDQEEDLKFTPIHVAVLHDSMSFLEAAVERGFNPWIRDLNLRVAFDHAWAKNNKPAMRLLYPLMHPNAPPLEPA